MDILIRDSLRRFAESNGPLGAAWSAGLPAQVKRLCSIWSVKVSEVLIDVDSVSWIAAVGNEAILKVGRPHREAAYEAAGLRFFDGRGAVRLLCAGSTCRGAQQSTTRLTAQFLRFPYRYSQERGRSRCTRSLLRSRACLAVPPCRASARW